jgi:hypothetical protein
MNGRSLIPPVAGALLFLSLAVTTLPRLFALCENARTLLPLSYEGRRERLMGPWYESVETLRRELPANEPVALITAPRDIDSAVFANYYLFPIHTKLFTGRDNYRNRAWDPTLPKTIVFVTANHAERTTYDVLRDRDLRAGKRVVAAPELSEPSTTFILPIAASLDGPAPETFVIEATIVNPNPSPAEVQMTFWPKGMVRTISIAPGATASYYDLLHQLFGVLDRGWMHVRSSQPLRAAFYFVNRGHGGDATLLPNATSAATSIALAPLHRDTKLFVINPNDLAATAVIADKSIAIAPHAFVSWPVAAVPRVRGDVYAFVTTRELNGTTDFLWPAK